MRRVCVQIDLERLRRRLSRREGWAYGDADVRDWLAWEGFFPTDGGWWQCQGDLGALQDDEIVEFFRQFGYQGILYTVQETAAGPLPV